MRPASRAALLAALFLSACGGTEPQQEMLQLSISLAGDVCGVTSADARVTASNMLPLGPVPLTVTSTAIVGIVTSVPAGTARTVTVTAYDARQLPVYAGSATVDVLAGRSVAANVTLARNFDNCPATTTGAIEITGTLQNEPPPPPPGDDVWTGPELAFPVNDAVLTSDGVLHLFDAGANRIHRLQLATRTILPDVVGTLDAVSMAVSPDGAVAYLGYVGGRMDAFDLVAGTSGFFSAAPATVWTMIVTGGYLFTIDDSGAWDTQTLFDRATGARVAWADWRDTSRSIVWSPVQSKVYFLDSGVSPTDVNMVAVDGTAGTLGAETDSPYHGDYALPNPIRLLPDESGVIVGSGIVFSATDLTYRTSLGLTFEDVAFLGGKLYLVDTVGDLTQLRVLSETFDIVSADFFPGQAERVFAWNGQIVLLTRNAATLELRFLAP